MLKEEVQTTTKLTYQDLQLFTIFKLEIRCYVNKKKIHILTPYYDPDPFIVLEVRGTKILAIRNGSMIIARNSSFFKKFILNRI